MTSCRYARFGITRPGAFGLHFAHQMDALLIGTFVSTEALGFYDRAYRTAQWPSLLLTSFTGRVAFSGYARLQNEARRLRQLFDTTLWVVTIPPLCS